MTTPSSDGHVAGDEEGNRRFLAAIGERSKATATYAAYRGLGELISRAPEPLTRAGSVAAGDLLYLLKAEDRRMITRHLTRVLFGRSGGQPQADGVSTEADHQTADPAVVRQLCRRSFRAYGRYWVEGARLPRTPLSEVVGRMNVAEGLPGLVEAMSRGHGVVMALPHVGSWEWGGAYLAACGYPMTSVAERVEPPELFDWFISQRRALGLTIEPLDGDTRILLDTLRRGGLVGLLCDRDLVGTGVSVEFFGEETTLPAGPATLALRTGAALVVGAVYSGPGRHHTGVISPPLAVTRTGPFRQDVRRLTQDIARWFETYIARAPEQWHVFQPNWPSDAVSATS